MLLKSHGEINACIKKRVLADLYAWYTVTWANRVELIFCGNVAAEQSITQSNYTETTQSVPRA